MRVRDGLVAGAIAGVLGGAPSTLHAALTGQDLLESTRAAGSVLLQGEERPGVLFVSGALTHVALSLGWGVVLSLALPARPSVTTGAMAGAGIAALDLGVIGRRLPRIRALPQLPQVADHICFGMVAAAVLASRRRR